MRDQEHFRQGPATLLEQLRDYISLKVRCRDPAGRRMPRRLSHRRGSPRRWATCRLLREYAWPPPARPTPSYTQVGVLPGQNTTAGKTYVFHSPPGLRDEPNPEGAALRACQSAYRQWIQQTGEHYDTLTSKAKLIEDVLVLPFPDLGRPKPIALPYATLGTLIKGRDDFLRQLSDSLGRATDGRAAAVVGKAVHGLGGVGKTRLAVEYAWQHQDDYTALLFVPADSPEALRRNLAGLCGPLVLDLPEQHVAEEEARLAAALHWLQRNPGWFLILDNLDTPKAAAEGLMGLLS